jgi:GDP-fucose transporter C1
VEVSFYNVARSLTLAFNVVLSFVLLGTRSSDRTLMCLGVVVVGFFIGSAGEMNFSLLGTVSGILSSLFVSLNSIFTKKILPVVNDNHWRLTFYNNLNACVLFVPLILLFETELILSNVDKMGMVFWSSMTVGGCLGFSIGIVTVLQIKVGLAPLLIDQCAPH